MEMQLSLSWRWSVHIFALLDWRHCSMWFLFMSYLTARLLGSASCLCVSRAFASITRSKSLIDVNGPLLRPDGLHVEAYCRKTGQTVSFETSHFCFQICSTVQSEKICSQSSAQNVPNWTDLKCQRTMAILHDVCSVAYYHRRWPSHAVPWSF